MKLVSKLIIAGACIAMCAYAQEGPRHRERPTDLTYEQMVVHDPVMAYEDSVYYLYTTGYGVGCFSSKDLKNWHVEKPCMEALPDWLKEIQPFAPHTEVGTGVVALTLFPGIQRELIEGIMQLDGIRGIILRTFGSGNAPTQPWLAETIRKATDSGKVVINITQCQSGGVTMGLYETSRQLLDAGVVSGHDMTIEAAITKLMVLFGRGYRASEVRQLMSISLTGELTETP